MYTNALINIQNTEYFTLTQKYMRVQSAVDYWETLVLP